MNRVKTVFAAFREMNRLEKRLIPTAVTVAFVTAVMPFINIWFTSKIIDLLDGGAGMKSLTLYIGLAVGINAVLFFVNCFLGENAVCLSLADVQQGASRNFVKAVSH